MRLFCPMGRLQPCVAFHIRMGFYEDAWVRGKGANCIQAATLPEATLKVSAPGKPLFAATHQFLIQNSIGVQKS